MRRIFKYTLQVVPRQLVMVPQRAELLSVAEQDGQLVLWASVEPDAPKEPLIIRIATTGDEIEPEGKDFVGTAMLGKDGPWFVAHVFVQLEGYDDPVDKRRLGDFNLIKREVSV